MKFYETLTCGYFVSPNLQKGYRFANHLKSLERSLELSFALAGVKWISNYWQIIAENVVCISYNEKTLILSGFDRDRNPKN
jgi:hypothetical protein